MPQALSGPVLYLLESSNHLVLNLIEIMTRHSTLRRYAENNDIWRNELHSRDSKATTRWQPSSAIQNTSHEVHTDKIWIRNAVSIPECASDSRSMLKKHLYDCYSSYCEVFTSMLLYSLLDSQGVKSSWGNRIKTNNSIVSSIYLYEVSSDYMVIISPSLRYLDAYSHSCH